MLQNYWSFQNLTLFLKIFYFANARVQNLKDNFFNNPNVEMFAPPILGQSQFHVVDLSHFMTMISHFMTMISLVFLNVEKHFDDRIFLINFSTSLNNCWWISRYFVFSFYVYCFNFCPEFPFSVFYEYLRTLYKIKQNKSVLSTFD